MQALHTIGQTSVLLYDIDLDVLRQTQQEDREERVYIGDLAGNYLRL